MLLFQCTAVSPLGYPKAIFSVPSLFTQDLNSVIYRLSYHCYGEDIQLFPISQLPFSPGSTLQKTDIFYLPNTSCPSFDFSIIVSSTANNLGVVLDKRLAHTENIAAVLCACRLFIHNISRIQSFLSAYSIQLLVNLDWKKKPLLLPASVWVPSGPFILRNPLPGISLSP